jgi:integrase
MKARGTGLIYQPTWKDKHTGEIKTAATWWIQFNVHGQRIRENSDSRNRADAARLLKQRLAEAGRGQPVGPAIEKTTVRDLAQMLIDDYRANGRRVASIMAPLAHLRDYFGENCRAVDISSDRVTAYAAARLDRGAKPATINRSLAALKRAFRLAAIAGKAATPPIITTLTEDNTRTGFFERADLEAVLQHLPAYIEPVIRVAYITGWRMRSEILTRRKPHLDLSAGWLRLEPGETKNKAGRQFPLTPELRAILEAQVEANREYERTTGTIVPWLFHRNGRPIGSFRKTWITACRKAGIPGRVPHDFRRTAVRNLERAGVPRSTAMKLTGHKTEAVYRRYAIVDEAMLKEGVEKLTALHELERVTETERRVVPLGTAQVVPKSGAIR